MTVLRLSKFLAKSMGLEILEREPWMTIVRRRRRRWVPPRPSSPFGTLAGAKPPPAASPPALKCGRAASHELQLPAPDRSRSAQWRARLLPGARRATAHHDANNTVRESARKLQNVIDTLERQRADDRKWLADNAKRID